MTKHMTATEAIASLELAHERWRKKSNKIVPGLVEEWITIEPCVRPLSFWQRLRYLFRST